MTESLAWAIFGLVIVFGFIALGTYREQTTARRRMQLRKMLHEERMAALEKEVPLPDTDADDLLQQSFAETSVPGRGESGHHRLFRRTVLGFGLVLLLGGFGWYLGMAAIPVTDETLGMQELASLGAIPFMVGLGLLIFWVLLGREAE